jgi:hypothetical protein
MPIVRTTAVATTVLTATVSAVALAAQPTTYSASVSVRPTPVIAMSVLVVPQNILENQTVTLSDFRQISVDKVIIDIATVTEDVAISFDTSFSDSVTMTDAVNRMFYGNIDFDPTDPDADPDPVNVVDADTKDIGKTLTDAATATDADVKTVGQVLTDSTSGAVDAINTKDVGKSLTDVAAATDAVTEFNTDKVVADSASITDAAAKELTRPDVVDSIATADDSFRSPGLDKTDSVTSADAVNTFDIGKNPDDSITATDAVDSFDVTTVLADSVTMTDFIAKTPGYEFDFDVTDADADPDPVTVTEVMAKDFTRPDVTDSFTVADATEKQFDTDRSDAVTASDAAAKAVDTVQSDAVSTADAAVTDTTKVLTDATTGATDALVVEVGKVATDSVSGTDAINTFDIGQVLADSTSVTDNLVLNLILGQSSPLYDFAFISDDKFTYFPVSGVLNEHLIHQPLVNGEFVLTTDPNAGIVYTIRTESYSYMFAGYGLNENQLN